MTIHIRTFGAALMLTAAILTVPAPATAGFSLNTIGPTGSLGQHGRTATVTAILACTAGQSIDVRVTLTQGQAIGEGVVGHINCTGAPMEIPVKVTAHGKTAFTPGPAQACARAVNRDRGEVVDTRQWCRADPVQLTA